MAKDREYMRNWRKQRIQKVSIWLRDYREEKGCAMCGEKDAACLQFHSPDSGLAKPYALAADMASMSRIKDAADRCEVICANCRLKSDRDKKSDDRTEISE